MELRIEKLGEIAITGMPISASTENGANFRQIPAFWEKCHGKGYVEALARSIPGDSRLGVMGVCVNDFDKKAGAIQDVWKRIYSEWIPTSRLRARRES